MVKYSLKTQTQLNNMQAILYVKNILESQNQLYEFTESIEPYSDAGEIAALSSVGVKTHELILSFSVKSRKTSTNKSVKKEKSISKKKTLK